MTATHTLNDRVEAYLLAGQHELAISLVQQALGLDRAEARRQVGAVAEQMRQQRAQEREKLEHWRERHPPTSNRR